MNLFKKLIKRYISYSISINNRKEIDLNEIIIHNLNEIKHLNKNQIEDLKNLLKDQIGTSLVESLYILNSLNKTKEIGFG